ncbi:conserved protein of unknown function [Mesotoga infera]|uniref:DZANK-type domain-containing protein n=1 Tax=Mesotoga infera TaxID=1236046 RepID=A0A7Z7LDW8_9BACT|nr:zinc ribbon domain-containing protein [Mesotoga infera]SSC11890.1 conserved protein of unknown function [Mesotoga infera]
MYNRLEDSTRIIIGIIGGIIYAVGVGLIIFSFASFFLAPAIGMVFTSMFTLVILGIVASSIGRALVGMARTRKYSGPLDDQRSLRREVQEDMTYNYTFVSDREAKTERKKSQSYSRCPECDAENDDRASTCQNCGASLVGYKKCSLCYKLNEMDKRFCSNCGHDFNLD